MEPMLASGLLGDAVCMFSCQVGAKYASRGCPKGSIRKKQEHLASRHQGVGNNCKQSRSWLALPHTEPGGSGEETAGGQVLRLYPQPVIDPRTLGHDTWQS